VRVKPDCRPQRLLSRPEGVGRAVAALAADPDLLSLTGQALSIDVLARRYRVDVAT
jgi:hypothetical protein